MRESRRVVSAENATISLRQTGATIRSATFDIDQGFTALVGVSGSGKTTLLRGLMGLLPLEAGVISHWDKNGEEVFSNRPSEQSIISRAFSRLRLETRQEAEAANYRSRNTGYIAQIPQLPDDMKLADYIAQTHAARGNKLDSDYVDYLTNELGVTRHLGKYAAEVSGGERQRIAIATALAHKPNLIFADEPTASLDTKRTGQQVMGLLREVSEAGATVICASHDQSVIEQADRVMNIEEGRVTPV